MLFSGSGANIRICGQTGEQKDWRTGRS